MMNMFWLGNLDLKVRPLSFAGFTILTRIMADFASFLITLKKSFQNEKKKHFPSSPHIPYTTTDHELLCGVISS